MATPFRPDGYPIVSPYLVVQAPQEVIDFLTTVFDAAELQRFAAPDGAVMHAELRLGDSVVMIGGAGPAWPSAPAHLHVYVADVDASYRAALTAGGRSVQAPEHRNGEPNRRAGVTDPGGNTWWISTLIS